MGRRQAYRKVVSLLRKSLALKPQSDESTDADTA